MYCRRVWFLTLLLTVALTCSQAHGVLVYRKGVAQPIRGRLVAEDADKVVLRVRDAAGERLEEIPRTEIELLVFTVKPARLAELDPARPDGYRDYAEELAAKRSDPDARDAAIRLFLIAAHLDTERLARNCLLGIADLARSPGEERRVRALLYLLDREHDRRVLVSPQDRTPPLAAPLTDQDRDVLLRGIRLLRQGKKREAERFTQRFGFADKLAAATADITLEEFLLGCAAVCRHCTRGSLSCPTCAAKGTIRRDGTTVRCPECQRNRRITCPECGGDYQRDALDDKLLCKLLNLEIALTGRRTPTPQPADEPLDSWAAAVVEGRHQPVRPLTLETVTEFDPRQTSYRDGKWVRP